MSHEETFDRDLDDDEEILRELLHLSGRVAARLREDGYRTRTVTMKARLANFTTLTRARTLPAPTDLGADLYHAGGRALPGSPRRPSADPSAGGPGHRSACLPARSSSRCCTVSGGVTWSARWIASRLGSAGVRPPRRSC